jgi:hypothetical protein
MMTLRQWTPFRGRPNRFIRAEGMRVSMSPRGDFRLNKVAWEALGSPEAVEFMFDMINGVIGIAPIEAWREFAFPVIPEKQSGGKRIHASPFCRHFMLQTPRTVVFNTIEIDDQGVMTLPIESLTAVSRRAR